VCARAQLYCKAAQRTAGGVRVLKQADFLGQLRQESAAAQTRNGYNPMLEDFGNYSLLLS
jgi:hypothetical protein